MSKTIVIIVKLIACVMYILKDGSFVLLDEKRLGKLIPKFQNLTVQAKQRELNRWLQKEVDVVRLIEPNLCLPNTGKKKSNGALQSGAQAFLSMTKLFEDRAAGTLLISTILCGFKNTTLRKMEPVFYPILGISSGSLKIKELLISVIQGVAPRRCWKHKHYTIKRKAVLDYGKISTYNIPAHIQDFSRIKIKYKKHTVKAPFSYQDTVLLIINANSTQIKEATPYIERAAVILLNSATGDLLPTKLPSASISAYNPEISEQVKKVAPHIAALLRWWWSLFDDEDAWARQIVQAAHASFGKLDSRYIRVELDPKKLRDAIRYQVLLSFFDEVEKAGFMTNEELVPYRQGAKEVFDPAPPEPVHLRHAEDPDVFLEIMRIMVENPTAPIVAEGERFVKRDKPLAAWRVIKGKRYLVFLEDTWARTYAKLVKVRKDIECSYLQHEHWERDFQKALCEQDLIKAASSGYRYRYDLMGDGTRDNTYVVAVPAYLLED